MLIGNLAFITQISLVPVHTLFCRQWSRKTDMRERERCRMCVQREKEK